MTWVVKVAGGYFAGSDGHSSFEKARIVDDQGLAYRWCSRNCAVDTAWALRRGSMRVGLTEDARVVRLVQGNGTETK